MTAYAHYTHNSWAHALRGIFMLFLGHDLTKWPLWADYVIYDLAKRLVDFHGEK
jgi:hypothetical protein